MAPMRIEEKPASWKTDPEWRLSLSIGRGELPHRTPPFRVEYANGALIRLVAGGRPLLWARVQPFWRGVWLLAPDTSESRPALPLGPLSFAEIRAIRGTPGSARWLSEWARFFALSLAESPTTALHDGSWEMTAGRSNVDDRALIDLGRAPGHPGQAEVSWGLNGSGALLAARSNSPDDAGRVKALRKLACDGTLPPLLLLFVSGLDLYVIIDGHDRLRAAALEGVPLFWVKLSSVRELTYEPHEKMREGVLRHANAALAQGGGDPGPSLDRINERLVRAFSESRCVVARTRATPIRGGKDQWAREVCEQLALLGVSADRALLAGIDLPGPVCRRGPPRDKVPRHRGQT